MGLINSDTAMPLAVLAVAPPHPQQEPGYQADGNRDRDPPEWQAALVFILKAADRGILFFQRNDLCTGLCELRFE